MQPCCACLNATRAQQASGTHYSLALLFDGGLALAQASDERRVVALDACFDKSLTGFSIDIKLNLNLKI